MGRIILKLAILYAFCSFLPACNPDHHDWLIPGDRFLISHGKMIQVASTDTTGGNNDRINLKPGEQATVFCEEGPGYISRIWVTIDSRDPDALRKILLRAFWDDEKTPSVEVPLGDFFGCGFEYRHHLARYCGMSSGGYYCYFPMPFNKSGRIEVINESDQEIFAFYYHINYYKLDRKIRNPRYFHSLWKRDPKTSSSENYVALEAEGDGHFVGMNFSGQPYDNSLFYLEGDEMIFVDGESVPSVYGTGFEDYFTSGWYFRNGEYSSPFHGLVLLDKETGRVTAYRHHIPDAIPFRKSIRVTYEHGTENEAVADFSTTVYWYQEEPHRIQDGIAKPGQRIPLKRPVDPGALDIEKMNLAGEHRIEDMSDFGVDWCNNTQVLFTGGLGRTTGISIDNLEENEYDLTIFPTNAPDYGEFVIHASGGKNVRHNGYNPVLTPHKGIEIKGVKTVNGGIGLSLHISGKDPLSEGYNAGLDAILLTPVRKYISDWWMIGPFPNPRENDYLRFGLDSVYPPEKEINFTSAYKGSGGKMVGWNQYKKLEAGYGMKLWEMFEPREFIVVYALTYIYSPYDQTVPLLFGSDDGAKIFLNDEVIYRFLNVRIAKPDQERILLNLEKGWNRLMIKAENNFGGFAFFARIIDPEKNLIISTEKN